MASSGDVKGMYKHDMVVSTRYRNDLPPPPMPPKLLDIDTGGLAQYLTTSFASGLVRREEPNIEVDAEGGMSIDMVGVPGYFLGDESAIMAPEVQPVLNAADHALLLSPDQIRNRGSNNTNVSFLRKTQYMTSQNARANDPFVRSNSRLTKPVNVKKPVAEPVVSRDDPTYIKRHIQKGFDIAYPSSANPNAPYKSLPITLAERDAWRNPTHPSNPKLRPVAFYPLLPDLAAKTDADTFASVKFDKPPLPALSSPSGGKRDKRIEVAILKPSGNEEMAQEFALKKEAHERNPELYADPGREHYDWDFCVPRISDNGTSTTKAVDEIVGTIKRKLNVADPDRNNEDLYPNKEKGRFEYERVRTFAEGSAPSILGWRYLALSLFDPESPGSAKEGELSSRLRDSGQGKAAYYYNITARYRLKADRVRTLDQARAQGGQAGNVGPVANDRSVDGIDLLIRDPDEAEVEFRANARALLDKRFEEGEEMKELKWKKEQRTTRDAERERAQQKETVEARAVARNGIDPGGNADAEDERSDHDKTTAGAKLNGVHHGSEAPTNDTTATAAAVEAAGQAPPDDDVEMVDAEGDVE